MPSKLSTRLMNAYMSGTDEDIAQVKSEIEAEQKARLTPKKENILKINTVLNDEHSSAIKVYDFLNQAAIGVDWWEWETETIEKLLFMNYGVALEDVNRDKVFAIRHLCRSDGAFSDWFEFNQICLSFCGVIADFEAIRAPEPGMVISTIKAMNYIRPDREAFYGEEVLKFICILLRDNGIYIPPPSIIFIINKTMAPMISDEMKSKWVAILNRYNEIASEQNLVLEENEVDIQARRLINAEAAALIYSE